MSGTSRGDAGGGELDRHDEPSREAASLGDPAERRPAAMCVGPGHVVMHGNPAFIAAYGEESIGLPAREILVDLPSPVFTIFDAAFGSGRPLAAWVERGGIEWRLTVVPRRHPETGEIFGILFRLRAREDLPDLVDESMRGIGSSAFQQQPDAEDASEDDADPDA